MAEITLGELYAVHLTSGQTVLTRITAINEQHGTLTMGKPMEFFIQPGPGGRASVSFIPFLSQGIFPLLDTLDYPSDGVVLVRAAPQQLENGYIEATGGVAVARPSIVLPH